MILQKCRNWQVLCKSFLYLGLFLICKPGNAQIDEPAFFNRVNDSYFTLGETDINNFSSWITSNYFKEATEFFYNEEVFPLELIWVKPNDVYFIRRPLPAISDSSKYHRSITAQRDMQLELRALLMDWRRFYAGRILADMPVDYQLVTHGDTVVISFITTDRTTTSRTQLFFASNGLLLRCELTVDDSGQKVVTYPKFKYTGEFWLCTGWQVQVLRASSIESGFNVLVVSQRIKKYWVPEHFEMTLQTSGDVYKIYTRVYEFRNIRVDGDIQVLNGRN